MNASPANNVQIPESAQCHPRDGECERSASEKNVGEPQPTRTSSLPAERLEFIRGLIVRGGPEAREYPELDAWYGYVHRLAVTGSLSEEDQRSLRHEFGEAMSPATLQGFADARPYGYAGDFEIIDKIYLEHISTDPRLCRWDHYFQNQVATKAVRNRKAYFQALLGGHAKRKRREERPLRVLIVGCGPGRDIYEYLTANPGAETTFECLDIDERALAYAATLNHQFKAQIAFRQQNALRYRPKGEYDLIWAAGIFDYFEDSTFRRILGRLMRGLVVGGELVVGNFATVNTSQAYMEFSAWQLHHRSAEKLISLALNSGVPAQAISIGAEVEGVNLFLHIKA